MWGCTVHADSVLVVEALPLAISTLLFCFYTQHTWSDEGFCCMLRIGSWKPACHMHYISPVFTALGCFHVMAMCLNNGASILMHLVCNTKQQPDVWAHTNMVHEWFPTARAYVPGKSSQHIMQMMTESRITVTMSQAHVCMFYSVFDAQEPTYDHHCILTIIHMTLGWR